MTGIFSTLGTVLKWSFPPFWPYLFVIKPLWKAFSWFFLLSWWKPRSVYLKMLKLFWVFYVWIPGSLPLLGYWLGSAIGFGPQIEAGIRWLFSWFFGQLKDVLIFLVDNIW